MAFHDHTALPTFAKDLGQNYLKQHQWQQTHYKRRKFLNDNNVSHDPLKFSGLKSIKEHYYMIIKLNNILNPLLGNF